MVRFDEETLTRALSIPIACMSIDGDVSDSLGTLAHVSDIDGDVAEVVPPSRRRGRIRNIGLPIMLIIVAAACGWPKLLPRGVEPLSPTLPLDVRGLALPVLGMVIARWHLRGLDETNDHDVLHLRWCCEVAIGQMKRLEDYFGYVTLEGTGVALQEPHPRLQEATSAAEAIALLSPLPLRDGAGSLGEWVETQAPLHVQFLFLQQIVAMAAVAGQLCWFHATAVTARRLRTVLQRAGPSYRLVKRWRSRAGAPCARPPLRRAGATSAEKRGAAVDVILRWLRATRLLRNHRNEREAAQAFAVVLADGNEQTAQTLYDECSKIRRDALRLARVRLDFTACLLLRDFAQRVDFRRT